MVEERSDETSFIWIRLLGVFAPAYSHGKH